MIIRKVLQARFKVGDQVRVIRYGRASPQVATITDVDTKPIVPHYMLDCGNGSWMRVPDFDLAPAAEFGGEKGARSAES